eukprot:GILK01009941.1.p1 GENE.GILK01009941.1~~GILK01009941.1.p1  ORF type:complete len:279 (+),score=20.73 GILK01009941.1:44-880(+)
MWRRWRVPVHGCFFWTLMSIAFAIGIVSRSYVASQLQQPVIITHSLAVVVPYRDRAVQLQKFVPYMAAFLRKQDINFEIIVVEQTDSFRFNRGAALNVGYALAVQHKHDYIALHDVDLLPNHTMLSYTFPGTNSAVHLSPSELHDTYRMAPTYLGGMLLVSVQLYETLNGFPTLLWGWGLEDVEFRRRLLSARIAISHPEVPVGERQYALIHFHPAEHVRDKRPLSTPARLLACETGLHTMEGLVSNNSVFLMHVDNEMYTKINVHFVCNMTKTPWCI